MRTVHVYFDYISPYAYFASERIEALCAARGAAVEWHPVLFAAILAELGHLGPAEIPSKRQYTFQDAFRTGAILDIPIQGPAAHPYNPLTALRISTREVAGNDQGRVVHALFRAIWADGIDGEDPEALAATLDAVGLDGAALVARTRAPEVKQALFSETGAAMAKGVFGVPTFVVPGEDGDTLIWGNDRIDHLRLVLDGEDPLDRDAVDRALSRPQRQRPR